ncbi:MAG: hypothetical protein QNJ32_15930 [Xenococcaceae cyanobacterium MO_167.B27]|nr:hypothetical protein [Xenococcaceae cyanobacterium MO_167.B27]
MDKQRQQAYLNLSQALLNCPDEQINNLFIENQELVDERIRGDKADNIERAIACYQED